MELGMLDYLLMVSVFGLVLSTIYYCYISKKRTVRGEYVKIKTHEQAINDAGLLYSLNPDEPRYKAILANVLKRNIEWNKGNADEIDMIKASLTDLFEMIEKKSKR